MEDEKFDLAKKINEQEAILSMLESEIEELRRESEVMENWDIEEEVGMDRNVYVSMKSHQKQPCPATVSWHGICSTPRQRWSRCTHYITPCAFSKAQCGSIIRY